MKIEPIFALVDCNNFYASCERVFAPRMKDRPIVVLSNNDGIVIARSNEVKQLGIPMGAAVFEIQQQIKSHGIEVFSSNYTLYADMSDRVMKTLANFSPEIEIYSIDEAFVNLAGLGNPKTCGTEIRRKVARWTGIPVSVGIAPTKTLAKVANRIAKKNPSTSGVFELTDPELIRKVLTNFPVEDIWGVGHRTAKKLYAANIKTALDLAEKTDINWIRNMFGVVMVRTTYELRGISCYPLELNPPAKKNLAVSRSFGQDIETLEQFTQSAAKFAVRAGEKLRQENRAAVHLTFFAHTSRFLENYYFNSWTESFESATNDTTQLVRAALAGAKKIYRPGKKFKKSGVVLAGLVDQDKIQPGLFDSIDRERSNSLMETIDRINKLFPCTPVKWAAQGTGQKQWETKFKHLSNRFTTRWDELPEVK